ncbi:hypothetical protein HID58_089245 [Brassica napus]|uniref:BnaCnng29430D protein n=3 Tax=Brassica TaxID=3705 RepID=A0A078J1N9_BRANA|nr:hypothetical protein HID58_089245 [Brassica napus]CAF1786079.1 unnamed protein product [Brassica napus]CDY55861.1 BnaCnng29430D [Brassica napus]VDD33935.1 unnamed protein product [Brassica oleracea]
MILKPMKTVRADEFTSRHSEDSIRSMAARSDEQMSFFLSTIDQIDELEHRTNCHVKRSIFADCLLM